MTGRSWIVPDGPFAGMIVPDGGFSVIFADPAWKFVTRSNRGLGRSPDGRRADGNVRHYETMTLDEIKALPLRSIAAKDCVLLMWITDPMLEHGMDVLKAYGFKYKTVGFYWAKTKKGAILDALDAESDFPQGTGYHTRANPEQCWIATRGAPKRVARNVRKLVISPRREHSRKPDRCRSDIERLYRGPYCELFARSGLPGWTFWGKERGKFDDVSTAAPPPYSPPSTGAPCLALRPGRICDCPRCHDIRASVVRQLTARVLAC